MSLVQLSPMLRDARDRHFAVGAFNYANTETALVIAQEAAARNYPAMLIISPWELEVMRPEGFVRAAEYASDTCGIPICLHLDHAQKFEDIKRAIEAGFPSVMIDASTLPFEENIALTCQVVEYSHARGVTVEGELGAVGRVGVETPEGSDESSLTDPDQAVEFIERTRVDALAVGIGNAHGMYKQRPELDFDLLATIRKNTDVPLVLHGGSGTPVDQLHKAIEHGIAKVNVASELCRAWLWAIHGAVERTDGTIWWATAEIEAREAVREVVMRWMKTLHCQ